VRLHRDEPDHGWVEVFATGATVAVDDRSHPEPAEPSGPPAPPFRVTTASARTGTHDDVVRPVHVDPLTACELAVSGRLFDDPIPHLIVADDHEVASKYLVWNAQLVDHHRRPLPAALHLLASPSMVVTVLELVPRRRIRWRRKRFVRHGIEAVESLAERLERDGMGLTQSVTVELGSS
jgi:hypothetical protein